MKVFFSYPHTERGLVADLAGILKKQGFEVLNDKKLQVGDILDQSLYNMISEADVVIFIVSGILSEHQIMEADFVLAATPSKKMIPIVIGDNTPIPTLLKNYQFLRVSSSKEFDLIITEIVLSLNIFSSKVRNEEESDKIAQVLLQRGINSHIESVLERLRIIEKRNKILAYILYFFSGVVLLLTIIVVLFFLSKTDFSNSTIEIIAVFGISYLLVAALITSFSKFLFTLAKSFMVEAIRCSDRIHAISFGKFYIDAFDEKVTREEIIKIFSTWNIDNGATIFRNITSEDYDPKFHELLGFLKKEKSK